MQEIENLFEKMKESLPNLVKEIDRQDQVAQDGPKEDHTNAIIKMPKVKDKES